MSFFSKSGSSPGVLESIVEVPFLEVEALATAREVWAFDREILETLPAFVRRWFPCENDQIGDMPKSLSANTAAVLVVRADDMRMRRFIRIDEEIPESVSIPKEWLERYSSGTVN